MDAEWAALNAAQQAAMIVWLPLALVLGWRITVFALDRRWPLPLVIFGTFAMMFGGAAVIIMVLGSTPK